MSVFRARKIAFINFGLLFIFLACWLSWYMYPLARSIVKEYSAYEMTDGSFQYGLSEELGFLTEHVFYGKVSYAAMPSLFGGSNIPFFDKIYFQLNGDTKCTFVLYVTDEILDELAEWYDFSAVNASAVPMEVRAVKVGDKYIVKSMASTEGELSWEFLMDGYHFYWCFMGLAIVGSMLIIGIIFIFVALVHKPRRVRLQNPADVLQ
ncbi:hypothetical protein [Fibrobacter sp. UBA4297]|uniref:hypothetical protein n=1 Tax=Fibrobacter sp. UBA4297 TaxID=1946536 RepID=UPI0025BE6597|nr:hypothetical protein [Fibrobacter sp. UBA4297]